jgi:OOP family OmpA-OmpF porin
MRRHAFVLMIAGVLGAASGCAPGRSAFFDAQPMDPAHAPKFIVFFDYRSATPSADMREVIGEAARTAHDGKLTHMVVIAHADGTGTQSYRNALSEKRAKAVKAVLVADGVPEDNIAAVGNATGDVFAKAGPGASEPQFRRAVIRLDK